MIFFQIESPSGCTGPKKADRIYPVWVCWQNSHTGYSKRDDKNKCADKGSFSDLADNFFQMWNAYHLYLTLMNQNVKYN